MEVYLLEKSRITFQQELERSYHIFYNIMSGAVSDLKSKLYYRMAPKYHKYTNTYIRTYRFDFDLSDIFISYIEYRALKKLIFSLNEMHSCHHFMSSLRLLSLDKNSLRLFLKIIIFSYR